MDPVVFVHPHALAGLIPGHRQLPLKPFHLPLEVHLVALQAVHHFVHHSSIVVIADAAAKVVVVVVIVEGGSESVVVVVYYGGALAIA